MTHLHSPFVAGGDYYPFGLTMDDRQIKIEDYRYGYQGQYSEENSQTGWNEFDLRMYDARTGRWISPDPYGQYASPYIGMGNNPVSGGDPDGGWTVNPGAGSWVWDSTMEAYIFSEAVVVSASSWVKSAVLSAVSSIAVRLNGATIIANGINRSVIGD